MKKNISFIIVLKMAVQHSTKLAPSITAFDREQLGLSEQYCTTTSFERQPLTLVNHVCVFRCINVLHFFKPSLFPGNPSNVTL